MRIVYKLRCKLSEPFRIENGFGLSPIRNKRELKALIKFCKNELKELETYNLGSSFKGTWTRTLYLYNRAKECDLSLNQHTKYSELYQYIQEHSGEYWS